MKVKLLLLSPIMLISAYLSAQKLPIDPETQKITYMEVVDVTDSKKEALYNLAKTWFVTGSGTTKMALELEDKEGGKLLGKIVNPVSVKNPPMGMFEVGSVIYTVTIIVKDGKYKYIFTDFNHDSGGVDNVVSSGALESKKTSVKAMTKNMPTQYQWGKIKEVTEETVARQIQSLKKLMSGSSKSESDF